MGRSKFYRTCVGFALGLGMAVLPALAIADPVDTKTARKMLFSPRGVDMVVLADTVLTVGQIAILQAILKKISGEGLAGYYGAVAVSPAFFDMMAVDPGAATLSGLFQVAEKYHSADAAGRVALAACQKARSTGQAACTVAAYVLPKRWAAQPVQLSVDATIAFNTFRKGKGPRAFAISQVSGAYAFAKGDGAEARAMTACLAEAKGKGSKDCEVVIAD